MQCNAKQCNAIQYSMTILLQIICRHAAFTLKTTSKTATRTAWSSCSFEAIPLHLIPLFLKKHLILLELKPRCSEYVVSKISATVFSFCDKNSVIKRSCSSRSGIVKF